MSLSSIWSLIKESISEWIDDYAPSMGAALAYYTVFSIAPLLVIVIAVTGLFLGEEAASGELFAQLRGLIGEEGAIAIQGLVKSASEPTKGTLATVIGFATLLLGATTVFGELQTSLNRIWRVPEAQQPSGIWGMIRARLLSFGMILGIGFLLLVSLVLSAALATLGKWWGPLFGSAEWVLQGLNLAVSIAVITGLFAMIYKFLPNVTISWRDVGIGAFVTAVLFSIGKTLIGIYLGTSGVVSAFGAAGSLVLVLVWVYYSAQIFLLGAEFTWVYSYRFGSRRHLQRPESLRHIAAREAQARAAGESDAAAASIAAAKGPRALPAPAISGASGVRGVGPGGLVAHPPGTLVVPAPSPQVVLAAAGGVALAAVLALRRLVRGR